MKAKTIIKKSDYGNTEFEGILEDDRMFYIKKIWNIVKIKISKEPTKDIQSILNNNDKIDYIDFIIKSDKNMNFEKLKELINPYIDLSDATVELNETYWNGNNL